MRTLLMQTFSFRTRLFVISGVIVSTVIGAVMAVGWSRIVSFEIERLEERLCLEARRIGTQPFRPDDAARFENDLMRKLRLASSDQLLIQMKGRNDLSKVLLEKSQWRTVKGFNSPSPFLSTSRTNGDCAATSFKTDGRQWQAARFASDDDISIVAVDLAATEADLREVLTEALKIVIPMALALTAFGAWLLAAITMRPVIRLGDAMKTVTQTALDQRLSTEGEDREFKVLIEAYNTMLARLETSFQQASRFSADAAHELKTPLTILQGRIENALHSSINTGTQLMDQSLIQTELTQLLDEVSRLSAITHKLLLLSQADAGRLTLQRVSIDLTSMLDEIALDAQMLLTHQSLQSTIARHLILQGDEVLLRQLFNNLIGNAVRYCRPDGWIKLEAKALPSGVEIIFSNATAIIERRDRTRFFDRFFRGDAAHNRRIDGSGLGLSLAREIARAHGGDLSLMASDSTEVVFRLVLAT